MKCLLIIDSLGSGGAERQCVVLAIALRQSGNKVAVFGYTEGDHFLAQLTSESIDYKLIAGNNPIRRILLFRRKIKEYNPDVIFAFLQTSSFLAEISSVPVKPWKLIVSERTDITNMSSLKLKIFLQFHRFADFITANSENGTNALISKAPFLRKKIHTIYNGLDLERFNPVENYSPNKRKVLVVVSSHQVNKNAKNLILALKNMKDSDNPMLPVTYWYGSDVSYVTGIPCNTYLSTKKLIQDCQLETDFFLRDPVVDIENVYRMADALILPSFFEGLPNAVCEAMASGLPILMSEISDNEILTKGNGRCFNPYSVNSIEEVIKWFVSLDENEIRQMRLVSRKKAEIYFPKEKMVQSYLQLLSA